MNKSIYRTGFLNALGLNFDYHDARARHRLRREGILLFSGDLYHYTSIAGLKGIVEEKGFWASDNRFMNDAEEGLNGVRLATVILKHRERRSINPAFRSILHRVREMMAAPMEHGHLIACFSTVADDLGQWRGYASGGVCLRLGGGGSETAPLFFGPDHLPYEAIYKERRKRVLLLSIVRSFEHEYAIDRQSMPSNWPDDHDENYVKNVHSKIAGSILGFKDKAFQNESEVRIVLSYNQIERYEGGLKFRVGSVGLIPYLRTGDHLAVKKHGGKLPLQEIIVGPARHQNLMAKSIQTFLKTHGYADTKVSLSKVPYRAP